MSLFLPKSRKDWPLIKTDVVRKALKLLAEEDAVLPTWAPCKLAEGVGVEPT